MSSFAGASTIMCRKVRFQRFLAVSAQRRVRNETEALAALKAIVGFVSRAELVPGSEMGRRWESLIQSFNAWNKGRPLA